MEKHIVLDDGMSGESLPEGEVRDTQHGHASVADFHVPQSLPSLVIVSAGRIKVERIPIVISGHSILPNRRHIILVEFSHRGLLVAPQRRLNFEISQSSESADDPDEGEGIDPVQDAGGASVLEHPGRGEELGHGPTDDGEHGEAGVTDFGFLHGVEVEFFGEAEGIEAVVSGVGAVEGGGAGEEGDGDGVGFVVVASWHDAIRILDEAIDFPILLDVHLRFLRRSSGSGFDLVGIGGFEGGCRKDRGRGGGAGGGECQRGRGERGEEEGGEFHFVYFSVWCCLIY
mmetsp:Transcript_8145/g.17573  ORF Transcript_8145/g.17573 Transcript_8145/m.17573 type:complete len:286 (-) Transcript_8145:159-1016(-)